MRTEEGRIERLNSCATSNLENAEHTSNKDVEQYVANICRTMISEEVLKANKKLAEDIEAVMYDVKNLEKDILK